MIKLSLSLLVAICSNFFGYSKRFNCQKLKSFRGTSSTRGFIDIKITMSLKEFIFILNTPTNIGIKVFICSKVIGSKYKSIFLLIFSSIVKSLCFSKRSFLSYVFTTKLFNVLK